MKLTFCLAALLLLVGCQIDGATFYRLMKQEGISQPLDGGYSMTGCGEGDTISQKFSGMKNGVPVSGVVCGGGGTWGKAYTIRYN